MILSGQRSARPSQIRDKMSGGFREAGFRTHDSSAALECFSGSAAILRPAALRPAALRPGWGGSASPRSSFEDMNWVRAFTRTCRDAALVSSATFPQRHTTSFCVQTLLTIGVAGGGGFGKQSALVTKSHSSYLRCREATL